MPTDASTLESVPPVLEKPMVADAVTPEPAVPAGLGNVAAGGVAWNLVVTLLTKVVGFGASVLFARLLLKSDFGAYYEALVTISLVAAVRDSAVAPVLVARQKELARWENAAFWMSVTLGTLAGLVLLFVGQRVALRPDGAVVARLLWLAAAASPLGVAGTVSAAKLQAGLRFGFLAKLNLVSVLSVTGLSVLMAWLGCGPYSLMVPMLLSTIVRSAVFAGVQPPALRWRPDVNQWGSLAAAGTMVAFSAFGWQVIGQSDTLAVARHFGHDEVGAYGFAYGLSTQIITVLATNIGAVLLPTLAQFGDDPRRQVSAYLRVCRVLAVVGVPFCLLQAVFAQPMVRPVFGQQWAGTEPILVVLSLGMAFAVVNSFAAFLLQSQHRLVLLACWTLATIVAFLSMVNVGVRYGGVLGVAVSVSAYYLLFGTAGMRLAIAPYQKSVAVVRVFATPLLCSLIALVPLATFPLLLPHVYAGDAGMPATLSVVAAYTLVFGGIYLFALKRLDREAFQELQDRVGDRLPRRWKRADSSVNAA